ncbi:universal stress protein [Streptacidiphilus rugosus]|uniref:universal stress protein n=1 Tax=Streptacidiphilus rugosus TaxID=405783 RepID=UPI00055E2F75|nr:universal stress protein [Streptacidiphilus rugosus]
MNRAVIVGVDGSAPSLAAAAWAAETAVLTGAPLRLLFVDTRRPGLDAPAGSYARNRAEAVRMLDRTVLDLRTRHPGLRADVELLPGSTIAQLLAASADATALVLGSRGTDRFTRPAPGATVQAVTARAQQPVVLAPNRPAQRMTHRPQIVLALDPGRAVETVVEFALSQAQARTLPLRVVHAWAPPALWVTWPIPPGEAERATAEDHVEQRLRDLVLPLAAKHPKVEVRFDTRTGEAAHVVVDEAGRADLLVLGRRRHTGALGPVARAAIHRAACPIALVPHG